MKNISGNQRLRKLIVSFFILFSVLAVSSLPIASVSPVAYAQNAGTSNLSTGGSGLEIKEDNVKISGAISKKSFTDNAIAIINYFIGFIGFIATVAFIYAGVLWVTSGGNEDSVGKARKIMTYAALGIVVIIISFSAVRFITNAVPSTGTGGTDTNPPGYGDPTTDGPGVCHVDTDCQSGFMCKINLTSGNNECVTKPDNTVGSPCTEDFDCPGSYCDKAKGVCGTGRGPNSTGSSGSQPTTDDKTKDIDKGLDPVKTGVEDYAGLSDGGKKGVDKAIAPATTGKGTDGLTTKIGNLEELLKDPKKNGLTDNDVKIIENIITALDSLRIMRQKMDDLKNEVPDALMDKYEEASKALDELIDDPMNHVKYNRFDTKYSALKQALANFPYVKAIIWATPAQGNVPFTVQLDALDSVDPSGGTVSNYKWTYLDNSGNEISLGSQPVVIHDFTEVGTYSVKLQASTTKKDSKGFKTATDGEATIRIKANPPTSKVKFRINGREPGDIFNVTYKEALAGLSFDPSQSTAALGRKIVKYDWNFGDNNVESRTVPTTIVHTFEKPGEYMVKLLLTDNIGIVDRRVIKLVVKSIAADIIVSPETGDVNTTFSFQGITSRSDDGSINDYKWEIDDSKGNMVKENNQKSFSYKFASPGTYSVIITVTDSSGAKDRYTRTVIVTSRPPFANFTYSIPRKNHPNKVEFNAIESYDPDDGDKITYSWDFNGDGKFDLIDSQDSVVTHEYDKSGDYRAKLQVQDSYGQLSQLESKVTIDSVLSGDIISSKRAATVGEPVEFEAQSKNAVAYYWEFGDGMTQSTEDSKVTHKYSTAGKYTVKMNFFDFEDNSNVATMTLLVGSGESPVSSIDYNVNGRAPRIIEGLCNGKDGAVVSRSDRIQFDARNSINTDGSSRMLTYNWKLPGGEISSEKMTNYKFDEMNKEGECFSATLIVRDQLSGKISNDDEIYFKVVNQLPEMTDFVITPPDKEPIITPAKILLKVINPKDSDGTIKKYRWWYFREGFTNEKLGLVSTTTPETELIITSFGDPDATNRYYFAVELIDNDNGSTLSTDKFGDVSYLDILNGPNLSPVVDFVMDKPTINVGDSITFISRSYDPQGEVLGNDAFKWDFDGDGNFDDTTSGPQVSRQFNTPGEYSVRLKVVSRGLSSSVTKNIKVEATQTMPQAAFIYTIQGNEVQFDASNSRFDPTLQDTSLRYEWDFNTGKDDNGNGIIDDDIQSTEMKPSFTYSGKGIYKVKLKIKQSDGSEGLVVRDVNLNETEAERQKNSYRSIEVTSQKYAMTTLNIDVVPSNLSKGSTSDVSATILNADGTPYNGKVFFEVVNGSGDFSPNPVIATNSKASSVFTASDSGKVRIRVRATGTVYGELTEEAVINVK